MRDLILVSLLLVKTLAVDPDWVTVSQGVADGHLEPESYVPAKIEPAKPYVEFPSQWFGDDDDEREEDGDYVPSTVPHGFFEKQKYAAWLQKKTLFAVRELKKWQEKHVELCSVCNSGIEFIEHAARVKLEAGQNPEDIARVTEPLSFTCDLMKESFPEMLSRVDCKKIHSRVMEKIHEALNPPLSDCEKERLKKQQGPCPVTKRIQLEFGGCGFLGAPAARACPKDGSSFEDTTAVQMAQRVRELRDELQAMHTQLKPDLKAMRKRLASSGKTMEETERDLIEDVRLKNKILTAELGNKRPVDILDSDVLDTFGMTGSAATGAGEDLLREINEGLTGDSSSSSSSSSSSNEIRAEKDLLKRLEKENQHLRRVLAGNDETSSKSEQDSVDLEKRIHDMLGDRLESTVERVLDKIMNKKKNSGGGVRDAIKRKHTKKTKDLLNQIEDDLEDLV